MSGWEIFGLGPAEAEFDAAVPYRGCKLCVHPQSGHCSVGCPSRANLASSPSFELCTLKWGNTTH